jgi:hypothetical protein
VFVNDMRANTDLDQLRNKIPVPAVFERAVWMAARLGQGSSPGPTGAQLVIWLPVEDPDSDWGAALTGEGSATWAEIDAAIGGPGRAGTRSLRREVAAAVLPGDVLDTLEVRDDAVLARGIEYAAAPFENAWWRHGWAIRLPGGLLVSLVAG